MEVFSSGWTWQVHRMWLDQEARPQLQWWGLTIEVCSGLDGHSGREGPERGSRGGVGHARVRPASPEQVCRAEQISSRCAAPCSSQDPAAYKPGELEATLLPHPRLYKGPQGEDKRQRDQNLRVPWKGLAQLLQVRPASVAGARGCGGAFTLVYAIQCIQQRHSAHPVAGVCRRAGSGRHGCVPGAASGGAATGALYCWG